MRNVDHNRAAEGPQSDDGVYTSVVARPSRRRKQTMIGAAGLAAIMGAGAVVTHQVRDDDTIAEAGLVAPVASDPPAAVSEPRATPLVAPSSASASLPVSDASSRPAVPAKSSVTPSPSEAQKTVAERASAARSANERAGTEVRKPLPRAASAALVDESKVRTVESGVIRKDRRTMRVVSSSQDLTDFRELGWVSDEGEPYGNARCSNKIRMSNNSEARARPTLLICWRTSEQKSAYTVAVNLDGTPSKRESIAALDKAWSKLP